MLRSWPADFAVEQLQDHGGTVPIFVPFLDLLPLPVHAGVGCGDAVVVPATLKVERVRRTAYPTRAHAYQDVVRYVELRCD